MINQFDNEILSAFLLYVDYRIQSKGSGYLNWSSQLYPVNTDINGLYALSSPFGAMCNDVGLTGAQIMSGVYVNGVYTPVGSGNLVSINHYKGAVYFSQPLPSGAVVSGNYSIKEVPIYIADEPEYSLLFENTYTTTNKYVENLSGLALDTETAPCVFLRTKNNASVPFGFGGLEDKTKTIRATIISKNEYHRMAVSNILADMLYAPFYIPNSVPFDSLGNYTGLAYSFTGLSFNTSVLPWIMKTTAIDVPRAGEYASVPFRFSFVDIDISTIKVHSY